MLNNLVTLDYFFCPKGLGMAFSPKTSDFFAYFYALIKKLTPLKALEINTIEEMLAQIEIIRHLYPDISEAKYKTYLEAMIPHNYTQVAVFENNVCIGLTGLWFGIKLWSGKYMEIDSFIVHPDHRSKGIGKMLTDYVHQKATDLDCTMIVLDAFTGNFTAHRFYYNQGYNPRGFHFIKTLNEGGLT